MDRSKGMDRSVPPSLMHVLSSQHKQPTPQITGDLQPAGVGRGRGRGAARAHHDRALQHRRPTRARHAGREGGREATQWGLMETVRPSIHSFPQSLAHSIHTFISNLDSTVCDDDGDDSPASRAASPSAACASSPTPTFRSVRGRTGRVFSVSREWKGVWYGMASPVTSPHLTSRVDPNQPTHPSIHPSIASP